MTKLDAGDGPDPDRVRQWIYLQSLGHRVESVRPRFAAAAAATSASVEQALRETHRASRGWHRVVSDLGQHVPTTLPGSVWACGASAETSLAATPRAYVREAEQIQGLRLAFPSFPEVRYGVLAKPNQPGGVRAASCRGSGNRCATIECVIIELVSPGRNAEIEQSRRPPTGAAGSSRLLAASLPRGEAPAGMLRHKQVPPRNRHVGPLRRCSDNCHRLLGVSVQYDARPVFGWRHLADPSGRREATMEVVERHFILETSSIRR